MSHATSGYARAAMDLDALATGFRAARRDDALAVLEGFHAIKHALRFGAQVDTVAAVDVAALEALAGRLAPDLVGRFAALATPIPRHSLAALTPHPPRTEVVAIARRPSHGPEALLGDGPVVALEGPRHLGNVGAVVRVAAAAGADAVVTSGDRDPWDPAALRGSAGLHFALPVLRMRDPATFARADRPLVALDPEGDALRADRLPARAVLVFGTERDGVSEATLGRADAVLALPMRTGVSSLNLATAVAAVLYAGRLSG